MSLQDATKVPVKAPMQSESAMVHNPPTNKLTKAWNRFRDWAAQPSSGSNCLCCLDCSSLRSRLAFRGPLTILAKSDGQHKQAPPVSSAKTSPSSLSVSFEQPIISLSEKTGSSDGIPTPAIYHDIGSEQSFFSGGGRHGLGGLVIGGDELRYKIPAIKISEEESMPAPKDRFGLSALSDDFGLSRGVRFQKGEKWEAGPRARHGLGGLVIGGRESRREVQVSRSPQDEGRASLWQVKPPALDPEELAERYKIEVEPADASSGPLIVGHEPTHKEIVIFQVAQRATLQSQDKALDPYIRDQLGIKRLERGTYVVYSMPEAQVETLQAMLEILHLSLPKHVFGHISGYLFEDAGAKSVAIFKPADEVRGAMNAHENPRVVPCSKAGVRPEREIENEVITAGLRSMPTAVMQVTLTSDQFHTPYQGKIAAKKGMLMEFIPAAQDLTKLSSAKRLEIIDSVTPRALQKLAITDLSLCNVDRNQSNIMVSEETRQLVPIDHANIAPARFQSAAAFTWASWAVADAPFTPQSLDEIRALDFGRDLVKIKKAYPDYPAENLESMELSYYLLKQGAAAGLTPLQIAWFYHGSTVPYNPMFAMYQTSHQEGSLSQGTEAMKVLIDQMIAHVKEAGPKVEENMKARFEEEAEDSLGAGVKESLEEEVEDSFGAGVKKSRDELLFQEYDKLVEW